MNDENVRRHGVTAYANCQECGTHRIRNRSLARTIEIVRSPSQVRFLGSSLKNFGEWSAQKTAPGAHVPPLGSQSLRQRLPFFMFGRKRMNKVKSSSWVVAMWLLAAAACVAGNASYEHAGEVKEALGSTEVLYQSGAINGSDWYDNSWSSTRVWNSTVVEYGTDHTLSVAYGAGGVVEWATQWNFPSSSANYIPAGSFSAINFVVNAASNASLSLSAQIEHSGTYQPTVSIAPYCGGSLPASTWVSCSVPMTALGGVTSGYNGILILSSSSTSAVYFDDVELVSSGSDAGVDSGQDVAVDSPPDIPADNYIADTYVAEGSAQDAYVASGKIQRQPHLVKRQAYASEGTASLLVDGAYGSPNAWTFTPGNCSPSSPCWGAVNVGNGPESLFVDWSYQDGVGDFVGPTVQNYEIWTSASSTNGSDGVWTQAYDLSGDPIVIFGNKYIHRSHLIQFQGQAWVKLVITQSTANEIDEIDVWDASISGADSYAFHGDSITHRFANLRDTATHQPSFQADVQAVLPFHFPLQVGAGIVGEGSAQAASEISGYLSALPSVRYWFNVMGTNDRCTATDSQFQANLTSWAQVVIADGGIPILVHPIWGNDVAAYCSDNGPAFNADVDTVVSNLGLMPAVQLYEATYGHTGYFDAGDVHPNAAGCAAINQVFAAYVSANLY